MIKLKKVKQYVPNYDKLPPLLQEYLQYKKVIENRTYKTIEKYAYSLALFFRWLVSERDTREYPELSVIKIDVLEEDVICSVTRNDILSYLMYSESERKNQSYVRYHKLEAIRSFYKYLCDEKIMKENPAENIALPKLEKKLPKYLTENQCVKLLDSIWDGPTPIQNYCIFMVFLTCGLRLSELVNINIGDIQESTLTVTGKGRKERSIPLAKNCLDAIQLYRVYRQSFVSEIKDKNAFFVSPRTGRRFSERRIQQIVKETLVRAGFEGYSTHKLRHTAATIIYQRGANIQVVKELLGHESLSTTEIYTHTDKTQLIEAINRNPLAQSKTLKSQLNTA